MRLIEEDEVEYIMLSCWDCYDSCGFICKNNDNTLLDSDYSSGHGVCCKPGSTSPECLPTETYSCSEPSFITDDSTSECSNLMTRSSNQNNNFFAFCPSTNAKMCGISDDETDTEMRISATFQQETIALSSLKYNSAEDVYDACFYQIGAEITDEEKE